MTAMDSALAAAASAFRFAGDDHPHARQLRRFRELVRGALEREPDMHSWPADVVVRKLLRLSADDLHQLRWVYLSLQQPAGNTGFAAVTYLYTVVKDRLTKLAFPADPYLATLPALLAEGRLGDRVLQFVPRQRLAFLTGEGLVGKLVRPADVAPAYERLVDVYRAASRADLSVRVAAPAGIDSDAGVFFQELLPGRDLAQIATETTLVELLGEAGGAVAELHDLEVGSAPRWSQRSFASDVQAHLTLVSLYTPEDHARLERAFGRLLDHPPHDPSRPSFCHGDLRCGHLLRSESGWAAIDFDGCRLADPCQDVARLLVFVKRDVPFLRLRLADAATRDLDLDDLVDAFVDGYESRRGFALDRRRLGWYLAAHELHYLARLLKRDLYDAVSFARGVERALTLAARAFRAPRRVPAIGGVR